MKQNQIVYCLILNKTNITGNQKKKKWNGKWNREGEMRRQNPINCIKCTQNRNSIHSHS